MLTLISSKKPSRVSIPAHAHPLARFAFSEMRRQRIGYAEIEHVSGVLTSTLKSWRVHSRPGIDTLEAVAGALGYTVLPVPRPDVLPTALRADLEEVAARHELATLPCLEFIAAAVGRQPHTRVPHSYGPRPTTRKALPDA